MREILGYITAMKITPRTPIRTDISTLMIQILRYHQCDIEKAEQQNTMKARMIHPTQEPIPQSQNSCLRISNTFPTYDPTAT